MHHVQLGVISAGQGKRMLENVGGVKAKIGGIENRMDHAASSTANAAGLTAD
ncbi:hypothetical protein D9M69_597150 [compost metagenome]